MPLLARGLARCNDGQHRATEKTVPPLVGAIHSQGIDDIRATSVPDARTGNIETSVCVDMIGPCVLLNLGGVKSERIFCVGEAEVHRVDV